MWYPKASLRVSVLHSSFLWQWNVSTGKGKPFFWGPQPHVRCLLPCSLLGLCLLPLVVPHPWLSSSSPLMNVLLGLIPSGCPVLPVCLGFEVSWSSLDLAIFIPERVSEVLPFKSDFCDLVVARDSDQIQIAAYQLVEAGAGTVRVGGLWLTTSTCTSSGLQEAKKGANQEENSGVNLWGSPPMSPGVDCFGSFQHSWQRVLRMCLNFAD